MKTGWNESEIKDSAASRLDAEEAVIGSILIDSDCLQDVVGLVSSEDFYNPTFKTLFKAIEDLYKDGDPVDAVTVNARANLPDAARLIIEIMDDTPTASAVVEYAKMVKNAALMRTLQAAVGDIQAGNKQDVGESIAALQKAINEVQGRFGSGGFLSGNDLFKNYMEHQAELKENPNNIYVKTGFSQIDWALGGGMHKGGVYIVGARPGVGKTTLSINIADTIALKDKKVLYISLEMSPAQIMTKRISRLTRIPSHDLTSGDLTDDQWLQMEKCAEFLSQKNFVINTNYGLTVSDIESLLIQTGNVDILIIDYLGLIKPEGKTVNRYEAYTNVSADLKSLAMRHNIPIFCLAQLNRESGDKEPRLENLRDSGAIEQDADAVLLLHRIEEDNGALGKVDHMQIEIAKSRYGTTQKLKFLFEGKYGNLKPEDNVHHEN